MVRRLSPVPEATVSSASFFDARRAATAAEPPTTTHLCSRLLIRGGTASVPPRMRLCARAEILRGRRRRVGSRRVASGRCHSAAHCAVPRSRDSLSCPLIAAHLPSSCDASGQKRLLDGTFPLPLWPTFLSQLYVYFPCFFLFPFSYDEPDWHSLTGRASVFDYS